MFKEISTICTLAIFLTTMLAISSISSDQQAVAQGNATQAANQTGEQMQAGMANTTQEARSAGNQTGEEAQSAMNQTGEQGQSLLNQTGEGAQSLLNQTGETLENINPFN
jgi:predicted PurR-regulated permease PerM